MLSEPVPSSWSDLATQAPTDVVSSSTKTRTATIAALTECARSGDLTPDRVPFVLQTLFTTYPLYADHASRAAVVECLRALVRAAPAAVLAKLVPVLDAEAAKRGMAAADYFVLLGWTNAVATSATAVDAAAVLEHVPALVRVQANCVHNCMAAAAARPRLAAAARRDTLAAVAGVLAAVPDAAAVAAAYVGALVAGGPAGVVLLGLLAEAAARPAGAPLQAALAARASDVCALYVKEVFGSKTAVPRHVSAGLAPFFARFVDAARFDAELAAPLEKAVLRVPEVVLDGVAADLFAAVPIDLSAALQGRLLAPLLASLKSSKQAVRDGAAAALATAARKCADDAVLPALADMLLTPLRTSKVTVPEQRHTYTEVLAAFPLTPALARAVPAGLIGLAGRESNELALSSQAELIFRALFASLQAGEPADKAVVDGVAKGLADKRAHLRRWWVMAFGDAVLAERELAPATLAYVADALAPVLAALAETNANASAAVQSKLVVAAFVATAVAGRLEGAGAAGAAVAKAAVFASALAVAPKPSFLLSDRVYTKLTDSREHAWVVRALGAAAAKLPAAADDAAVAWALALVYMAVAPAVGHAVRTDAVRALTAAYVAQPAVVGRAVVAALWRWVGQLETAKESSPAIVAAGQPRLRLVLQAITPAGAAVPAAVLHDQLVALLVLTHHTALPPAPGWIALCQRVGVDPGHLADVCAAAAQAELVRHSDPAADVHALTVDAAMRAGATLAFVQPERTVPFLKQLFEDDLSVARMAGIDQTAVDIWRTPADVAFVDVLSKDAHKYAENKNVKDYETLKWEAEVRAELAKKSAGQRKLTKDERAKVQEQLRKEAAVRQATESAYRHLRRGMRLIGFLSDGVSSNAPALWFAAAANALVYVLQRNAYLVVGPLGVEVFLGMTRALNARLGPLRLFVGVALLRAAAVPGLPASLLEESTAEVVTRVLHRLRFLSEQRPLDTLSLIYIIPLVLLVFAKRGIDTRGDAELADEQILLAIEALALHTDLFADEAVERADTLRALVALMQAYPSRNKAAKECLMGICQSVAPTLSDADTQILLDATIAPDSFVRAAVLEAIDASLDIAHLHCSREVWIACHDEDELPRKTALSVWRENELEIYEDVVFELLAYLDNADAAVRAATAKAVADVFLNMADRAALFARFLAAAEDMYRAKAAPPPPVVDEFGMVVQTPAEQRDPWEARSGLAATLRECAPFFEERELEGFVRFLLEEPGPLCDRHAGVRQEMRDAAAAIIQLRAKDRVDAVVAVIETALAAPAAPGSETQNMVREAAIILYASAAQHLDDDARLPPIIDRLLATLRTPSETVQHAVCDALPPLVRRTRAHAGDYIARLLDQAYHGDREALRKGAAYGVAGVVKGTGIAALAQYDIIRSLAVAAEAKKDAKARQGVQYVFKTLSLALEQFFEPYVIEIVPLLLASLGDPVAEVRDVTAEAAKEIMKHTSGYGIKQLIPLVLDSFNQTQWRSKKGAVELLGTMAYLDPQQLSQSLSTIIPEIVNALNDTHKEVRRAANQSLQRFGEVISNPEIQQLVPVLLKAISDPTRHVDDALDALLKTAFVHYIDGPSLAIVVHILQRGLRERSAATKRKACQIVGNMASLTDSRDLVPYLQTLVAELEVSMVDPVPATRATASRALGSLIEKLGEDQMPDLIPKLLSVLRADDNAGDRLGAAQALSEVIYGVGIKKLDEILPTVLKSAASPHAGIRESFMNLMVFLPASFGASFSPYLARVIPPVLAGLADEAEPIRDISLRAGRLIVKNYATRAVDLLLPELERGLSDENYRIRLSSIELTGDLLYQITGVSAKTDADDDAADDNKEVHTSLIEVLGKDRRDRILSALYLCRSDVTAAIRNAAVEVWKSLIANTPRTVREILPVLSAMIIRKLSSADDEQRANASQTLADLVRRFGDSLLVQLLPTFETGLYSADPDTKHGICVALSEIMEATPVAVLETHEPALIQFLRSALVDSDADVRGAAAHAFDTFQEVFGDTAVDAVLPHLLQLLADDDQSEYALAALVEIMASKADVIFPILLPILLKPPISPFNARAIGTLAEFGGEPLLRRLDGVLRALFAAVLAEPDAETQAELGRSVDRVVVAAAGFAAEDGAELDVVNAIFADLAADADSRTRAAALDHVATLFEAVDGDDLATFAKDWIAAGVAALEDPDDAVVRHAWKALATLVAQTDKDDQLHLVAATRAALDAVGKPGLDLPGFALPKGPNCVLPVLLQGLMYGSPDVREQAARGIAAVAERTSAANLRPFVTHMTGPLIRTVGERYPSAVKVAILETLTVLLRKIPAFIKPFLPQLQRTFIRSVADAGSDALRTSARVALLVLVDLQPRVDPVITELVNTAKADGVDDDVKTSVLQALFDLQRKLGPKLAETLVTAIYGAANKCLMDTSDDRLLTIASRIMDSAH
ncbi:armadillo-type protein [Dipodascopsis tothii]|uniref:armadillo-type protein n=1 Tax=Dipodascopsis tothii TaxID=44089 RepID=UPI0034CE7E0E